MQDNSFFWVYILKVKNGNYYTGYTSDIARRFTEHLQENTNSKYTKAFKAVALEQAWKVCDTKGSAMSVEIFIKQQPRSKKELFILKPKMLGKAYCLEKENKIKIKTVSKRSLAKISAQ